MSFWIFLFTMNLLIPFTMIGFGKYFSKTAPKDINGYFGYRTSMSIKNKETWFFAHNYCGKIWFYMGIVILIISVVGMLLLIGKEEDSIENYSLLITGIQIIFILIPIPFTEIALRKKFDTKGNRK